MLYKGIGMNAERIQGGWVDTPEVENIVSYISAFAEPQFDEAVFRKMEEEADEGLEDDFNLDYDDDSYSEEEKLLRQAVEIILRDKRPTISYVQRSLKIGYNKAATLVDEMEARGILGPQPGSGMREILISSMADLDDDFDKA
jgi:S-DNA-T family DNA segregation ATPase FtsK/SpoIIIE